MDEQTANTKYRRKPVVAAILSFIVIGLGYVYCGKIIRGILISFISAILVPVVTLAILSALGRINIVVIWASILISLLLWIAVIIDSCLIARNTRPDYELKEYNRWYIYMIVIITFTISTNRFGLLGKLNLLEACKTSSLSMYPTIEYHDRFLANKAAYKKVDPKRGDVIVFISSENRREDYVKRVVAVAGDTVEMKNNQLFINGKKLEREDLGRTAYIDRDPNKKEINVEGEQLIERNGQSEYTIFLGDTYDGKSFPNHQSDFPETKIPENYCFVLGDNRNLSKDSRNFGAILLATVKGRAEYIYWPPRDWARLE